MKRGVREWVRKAEADYRVALRELAVPVDPSPEAVCFHAQQCVEKYLKAILQEHDLPIPKVHDLVKLWILASPSSIHLSRRIGGLGELSAGAVEYRYPGKRATTPAARRAVRTMERTRTAARSALGLL